MATVSKAPNRGNAAAVRHEVALPLLKVGASGIIARLCAPEEELMRLRGLGICEGRKLEMVRQGSPAIVKVLGSRVGICGALAANVFVKALG